MSSNDIAIRVSNLNKRYEMYEAPQDRLKQFILPRTRHLIGVKQKQYFREFWALKDVSLEVNKGETVGIIGRNGSGKSTLLQLICGTLTPTSGIVETNGRIAALLELGSGFNPEFTGRENVYLNGAVLGLTQDEIDERFDAIVAFAEIGQFIDQPLKTYSSGMFVRLAFAVQINVDPEILIVDEALSVGDFFFQQKCFARLRKMRENGLTLLFVSHDMGTVRDLCPESIYLIKGKAAFIGDSQDAIRAYLSEDIVSAPADTTRLSAAPEEKTVAPKKMLEDAMQVALWRRDPDRLSKDHRLLAVVVRDKSGIPVTSARMGEKLIFQILFRSGADEAGHIAFTIKNKYDQIVSCTGSSILGMEPLLSKNGAYGMFEIEIDCMIEAGLYSILVSWGISTTPNKGQVIDITGWIGPLKIDWDYEANRAPFLGMVGLPVQCRYIPLSPD